MDIEFWSGLVFGAGMFWFGWWVRGASTREVVVPAEAKVVAWRCPQCERVKELPADLVAKVLVCNNCQVRLERQG